MKCSPIVTISALLSLSCFLMVGCSDDAPPEPVDISEVPQTLEAAFKNAPSQAAQEAISAVRQKDDPRAFLQLQGLTTDSNLTPEQREAAAKSLMAVSERLQKSAAEGDARAAEVLDFHRAHK